MRTTTQASAILAAALLAGACTSQKTMDDAMRADLEAASTATLELAPRAAGQQVVSAIESKNPTQPRVAPVRRATAPARTPQPETRQVTRTAETQEPPAVRPATRPAVQPPPPGGYKTVNEVIRNAPFPIKP